jgi:single-stranded-DNA-specific exonuclease
MNLKWVLPETSQNPIFDQILAQKNLTIQDLRADLDQLPDEGLLSDIDKVAHRIISGLYRKEKIVIFGHDDADGLTSTYILYDFLDKCGFQNHHYYIPNRLTESHGIQESFLQFVEQGKYTLVVTVDNGIVAFDGVEQLTHMGCDVIITDHHLTYGDELPKAFAVVNPKRSDDKYPYKMPAGVGLTLLLIRYLARLLKVEVPLRYYIWTAVGSLADKVPLDGVNHILVRYALDNFYHVHDDSFDFLLRLTSDLYSYNDKLNFLSNIIKLFSNGRQEGGNHLIMRFLLADGLEKHEYFTELDAIRTDHESRIRNIQGFVTSLIDDHEGMGFIYYDDTDQIPYPLLGMASSQVCNTLHIPTVFLKNKQDVIVCEGRCGEGFNMVDAFRYCEETLIQYGGHARAAGFTMQPGRIKHFLEKFNEYLQMNKQQILDGQFIQISCPISLTDLTDTLWNQLELLQPYGMGNPEPIFLLRNVVVPVDMICYLLDYEVQPIKDDKKYDILFQWKSHNILRVIDYRLATENENKSNSM